LKDQIALGEVENKGLDRLEHASRGEFQIIEAAKGGSREKVRAALGKGEKKNEGDLLEGLESVAGFDNGDKKRDSGVTEGIVREIKFN